MKNCNPDLIFEYASGELHSAAAAEFERHSASCVLCASQLEQARAFQLALQPDFDPSAEFTRAVMSRVARERAHRSFIPMLQEWLFPTLQIAFAAGVLLFQVQSNEVMDVGSVLISEVTGSSSAEEFSPRVSDFSQAFGILVGES